LGVKVWHFGGNGHCPARLDGAREALARRADAPALIDVPYPGFEGRAPSRSWDAFLDDVGRFCESDGGRAEAGYASGIGALIALSLRARGGLVGRPLTFQGPVLWGLETRAFPRVMRAFPPARRLLRRAFGLRAFQDHFVAKQFRKPLAEPLRSAFFAGYARCEAFGAFFDWLTPASLRSLERDLAAGPGRLDGVTVWLGGEDRVVGPPEVEATERALGVRWPVRAFPGWGHYPMIDDPEGWAVALCDALAPPRP